MLAELGHFCLILALILAMLQITIFVVTLGSKNSAHLHLERHIIRGAALGQAFFVVISFMLLAACFVLNDFSVAYVAQNSNSLLPTYYKITAIWGAHEGSLLLWALILGLWIIAVFAVSRKWQLEFSANVLAILGIVNAGFLILLLAYSNPFLRLLTDTPFDGNDLNPVLQDAAMISHPPILYMGYVGAAVPFAFAVAALITGKLDMHWAKLLRPWALLSWLFLTLGITIGSWWAYYELGWGGWWFWDPVENASFMPWLTGTALLHCLAVASKNARLLLLAVFLAITTFALSLLGTFIVRSGIISSVHAFASDPQRGLYILQFLLFVVGGALLLYGCRASAMQIRQDKSRLQNHDVLILANNIILLVAAAAVLLGTLYPVLHQSIYMTSITVGHSYFNAVFLPLMLVLTIVLLFAIQPRAKLHVKITFCCFLLTVAFLNLWFQKFNLLACLGLTIAAAIIYNSLAVLMRDPTRHKIPMQLAHIGLAITMIGISITTIYEIERDVSLKLGEQLNIAKHQILFKTIEIVDGPNYISNIATFEINKPNASTATLHPEKRLYLAQELPTTETSILPGVFQDIYIALGQQLEDQSWSVRIYYKPFVRWIWSGAILMIIGAIYAFIQHSRKYVK